MKALVLVLTVVLSAAAAWAVTRRVEPKGASMVGVCDENPHLCKVGLPGTIPVDPNSLYLGRRDAADGSSPSPSAR